MLTPARTWLSVLRPFAKTVSYPEMRPAPSGAEGDAFPVHEPVCSLGVSGGEPVPRGLGERPGPLRFGPCEGFRDRLVAGPLPPPVALTHLRQHEPEHLARDSTIRQPSAEVLTESNPPWRHGE